MKNDYFRGLKFEETDDEEDSPALFNSMKSKTTDDEEENAIHQSISELTSVVAELKSVKVLENINSLRDSLNENVSLQATITTVKECFKCPVCYDREFNYFYFCPSCGCFCGCFACNNRLSACPLCRAAFPALKKPMFIPQLAESMKEEIVTRAQLQERLDRHNLVLSDED